MEAGGIGGHVARGIIGLLVRKARRTAPVVDVLTSARVARYPRAARVFGWILLAPMVAAAALLTYKVPPEMRLVIGAFTGALVLGVVAMVLDFTKVSLSWTDSRVIFTSPWRGTRALQWEDFAQVKFSSTWGWFVVSGRDGTTIRPSMMLSGLVEFFAELKMRSGPSLDPQIGAALELWARKAGQ